MSVTATTAAPFDPRTSLTSDQGCPNGDEGILYVTARSAGGYHLHCFQCGYHQSFSFPTDTPPAVTVTDPSLAAPAPVDAAATSGAGQ